MSCLVVVVSNLQLACELVRVGVVPEHLDPAQSSTALSIANVGLILVKHYRADRPVQPTLSSSPCSKRTLCNLRSQLLVKLILPQDADLGLSLVYAGQHWKRGRVAKSLSFLISCPTPSDNSEVCTWVFSSARQLFSSHHQLQQRTQDGTIGCAPKAKAADLANYLVLP